jgi:hypothetical protein
MKPVARRQCLPALPAGRGSGPSARYALLCGARAVHITRPAPLESMHEPPSLEVAARRARHLRDAAAGLIDLTLGDPPPGRSHLDALRARPPEQPVRVSISAVRGDDRRGDADRAERIMEGAARRRSVPSHRGVSASPYRGSFDWAGFDEEVRGVFTEHAMLPAPGLVAVLNERGVPGAPGWPARTPWTVLRVRRIRRRLAAPPKSAADDGGEKEGI